MYRAGLSQDGWRCEPPLLPLVAHLLACVATLLRRDARGPATLHCGELVARRVSRRRRRRRYRCALLGELLLSVVIVGCARRVLQPDRRRLIDARVGGRRSWRLRRLRQVAAVRVLSGGRLRGRDKARLHRPARVAANGRHGRLRRRLAVRRNRTAISCVVRERVVVVVLLRRVARGLRVRGRVVRVRVDVVLMVCEAARPAMVVS